MIAPWIVRDAAGRELSRGGDWPAPGTDGPVRVLRPEGCGGSIPRIRDEHGHVLEWQACMAEVIRTRAGTPTGRCTRCWESERARRAARQQGAGQQAEGGRQR